MGLSSNMLHYMIWCCHLTLICGLIHKERFNVALIKKRRAAIHKTTLDSAAVLITIVEACLTTHKYNLIGEAKLEISIRIDRMDGVSGFSLTEAMFNLASIHVILSRAKLDKLQGYRKYIILTSSCKSSTILLGCMADLQNTSSVSPHTPLVRDL